MRNLFAGEDYAASTTTVQPVTEYLADYLGGVVVGEGCFTKSGMPTKFTFSVSLGAADFDTCNLLKSFLGVGHLVHSPRRQPHYDDEVAFQVRKLADLAHVVIPFMDEHLAPSHKRVQYSAWREEVLDSWAQRQGRALGRPPPAPAQSGP